MAKNKGDFHVSTMLGLIIAAIILAIFGPMLFGIGKQVYASVLESLGLITLTNVEKAMQCSYYRCVEGCASIKMEEKKWTDGNDQVTCNDFCNNLPCKIEDNNLADCYTDTNKLTVCGWHAKKYPVSVSTSKEPSITKSHITDVATCIVTSDSTSSGIAWDENFVYLDDSALVAGGVKRTDDCAGRNPSGNPIIGNAIETAKTKIPVYIYTYRGGCPASWCAGWNNLITELTATAPQVECKSLGTACDDDGECCSLRCHPTSKICSHEISH